MAGAAALNPTLGLASSSALPLEERRVIEAAQAFVTGHVRPLVAERERGQSGSRALFQAAGQAGLLGIEVPVQAGGLGLSFGCKARVAEIIAAADFGLSMALINSQNVAQHLVRAASPALAGELVPALLSGQRVGCTALTEPGVGSDFSAITTLATPSSGGWRLDGEKAWIVNAGHAEVFVVYAQTQSGGGARSIAAFVVDAAGEGFVRRPPQDSATCRAIEAGSFQLRGYRCEPQALLHPPGQAFKAAMASINAARTYVAAMCCGMVAECLRVAAAYGMQRTTFGRELHEHQGWRWSLADAAIDLEAGRLLVEQASRLVDAGQDAQEASARAKVFATRMAGRHVAALMHAMGAEGLREAHPFARHLGAAQVATLVDGSTEMLLERLAKGLKPA